MVREIKQFKTELAGRPLEIEIGKVANLANGACTVRYGDTVVLVTAVASGVREGIDFFPLSVEFEEKMYAVGKIPGGFIKREGRPSEKAVLTARLIDRPIRPLFPDNYFNEVQIVATVMSVDQDCPPDIPAMIGTSVALSISDIPFNGPIAAVSVGYVDDQLVINPDAETREKSILDLVVAGTEEAVMMVEAGAEFVPEDTVLEAIMTGHGEIKNLCRFIDSIQAEVGKEKMPVPVPEVDEAFEKEVIDFLTEGMQPLLGITTKQERSAAFNTLRSEMMEAFLNEEKSNGKYLGGLFKKTEKKEVRRLITRDGFRPDGRDYTEIRPITCEVGLLPRTHGSGLFSRGLTQALTITTLGALGEGQRIDGLDLEEFKRYMHHYNFPHFSVGETGFMRTKRREIGHGALGERALVPVLPAEEDFPYAIRLVSEVLTSNGSTSQASICGSTLSMLDAGVPLKDSVAGIAMGLIKEGDDIAILSDIQGLEDFLGDMDFKVAGTRDGVTALQMDIKIDGLSREILETALEQARVGRLHILDKMNAVIDQPREEMSPYAPRVLSLRIHPDKIREVIGAGGKVITKITTDYNCKIDIEDDGFVLITAENGPSGEAAKKAIENIVKDIEVGEIYKGKIVRILKFGAFVELLPGKEGLVRIGNMTNDHLPAIEDRYNVGDELFVKVIEVDSKGRINLSRKALLDDEGNVKAEYTTVEQQ